MATRMSRTSFLGAGLLAVVALCVLTDYGRC